MIKKIPFYFSIKNASFKGLITILFSCYLFSNFCFCQTDFPNLSFRSLTTKDGLTSNDVRAITQADDGQMWIGTSNGLNSYDGNKITNYFHGETSAIKLNMNGIFTMVKDEYNNLWISDRIGLTKISLNNYSSHYFSQFKDVHQMVRFRKGILFASTEGVFTIVDTTISRFNIPLNSYKVNDEIVSQYIYVTTNQRDNLFLTSKFRIHKISSQQKEIKYYQLPEKQSPVNFYVDQQNDGWISTWKSGLFFLDSKVDSIRQVLSQEHSGVITGAVGEWKIGKHEYIVGRYSYKENGLIMIDKSTMNYKIYDLNSNILSLYVDDAGNLWIGTSTKGILIASHLLGKIRSIPIISTKTDPTQGLGSVNSIYETTEHFWLAKRYSHGVFKYDKNWNLIKEFGTFKVNNISKFDEIADAYDFKLVGNMMYATNDLGMFLIDNTTDARKHIFTPEHAEVKLRNIIPLNDSTWFIRSLNRAIYLFNPKTNSFVKKIEFDVDQKFLTFNYLFKTSQNVIVATTASGIYIFDEHLGKFILKDHPLLNQLYIIGVAEDQNNILWLCNNKGICSYDLGKNKIISEFENYPEMGTAFRVVIDPSNHVWFANSKGYWSWDQEKQRMLKLNFESGLISDVEISSVHVGKDGSIYLGGPGVLYKLNPDSISSHLRSVKVIVSKISVNNEVKIPSFSHSNYQLNLPAGLSTIQVEFAVPDYSIQHSHDYQFKFADSDTWSDTKEGTILIPNLSHGNYQILMKGISNFSGAETDIVKLNIKIEAYWYQSWWFKVLIGMVVISLFYLFYRWRLTIENDKNKLKTEYEHRMIHLEMQNLRSQMNPHFIFNALNSINGFIVENQTHLASDYLTKFSKLIRMILDHSHSDLISLAKELEALKLYVMMEKNRFDQSFDFEIVLDETMDLDQIEVPPLILQPYIENAIWHGLMHQEVKGSITIQINQDDDQLCFIIEDNGVGRQKASELKSKKNIKSNSYGMQITYNRIKNHHSTNSVVVSDIVNGTGKVLGTKVIILLKIA